MTGRTLVAVGFLVAFLFGYAIGRTTNPPAPAYGLPGGSAKPVQLTDQTGNYSAIVDDAGLVHMSCH